MRKNEAGRIVFDFDDVINVLAKLSNSQGFYGRLLRDISEMDDDEFEELEHIIESQNFTSVLDVVMFFEGKGE